jgi:hypothetical protein
MPIRKITLNGDDGPTWVDDPDDPEHVIFNVRPLVNGDVLVVESEVTY